MRCKFCGTEIKEGNVYCLGCGREVQVVPDFDELEEELLPKIVSSDDTKKTQSKNDNKKAVKPASSKRTAVIGVACACVFLIIISVVSYSYFNSYSYAFKQGKKADEDKEYEQAAGYYKKAIARKNTVEALLAYGIDLYKTKDYTKAEEILKEALELCTKDDIKETSDVYRALLSLYSDLGNYDAIEALIENNSDSSYEEIFEEYYIRPPDFSETEGDYDDDISLTLESIDGYDIYYTTDDTDPSSHNGQLYTEPILLEKGKTTVSACCVNDDDKWGRVEKKTYNINYKAPAKPSASPSSGTYYKPTFVELSTKTKGAEIYYTWDGSEPTKSSMKYESAIEIPEGNNILSAIAIDSHDMVSPILRCNLVYLQ